MSICCCEHTIIQTAIEMAPENFRRLNSDHFKHVISMGPKDL